MVQAPEPIPAIVDREFPRREIRGVADVSGGQKSTYLVSLSGEDVVVSVGDAATAGFATEPAVMELVRGRTSIPVPEVIASDVSDPWLPPYSVSERVDGNPLSRRYASLDFDYRPANLLVADREITAVLDWGLSIAGHSEYDFLKAEKNFLRAHFELETRRDRYRPRLYRGYRDEYGLDPGWRARREFYDLAFTLESMYSFPRWTREMSRREQADMETTLRTELGAKLEGVSL
jgi:aminoglycoside phosphotransferase (APT) family kinase protein